VVASTPKVSDYLKIKTGSPVIVLDTLRFVHDQPMSSITHFLNPAYVQDIEQHYCGGSLHDYLETHYGLHLKRISAVISATRR